MSAFQGSLDAETERVAREIVDASLVVHKALGPGLLESVYEVCLAFELAERGFEVVRQMRVPIHYKGVELDADLRIDLLVDNRVVIEIKAVDKVIPLFKAQCLTYLKLTGHRLCLLINFNVELIRDGISRVAL